MIVYNLLWFIIADSNGVVNEARHYMIWANTWTEGRGNTKTFVCYCSTWVFSAKPLTFIWKWVSLSLLQNNCLIALKLSKFGTCFICENFVPALVFCLVLDVYGLPCDCLLPSPAIQFGTHPFWYSWCHLLEPISNRVPKCHYLVFFCLFFNLICFVLPLNLYCGYISILCYYWSKKVN